MLGCPRWNPVPTRNRLNVTFSPCAGSNRQRRPSKPAPAIKPFKLQAAAVNRLFRWVSAAAPTPAYLTSPHNRSGLRVGAMPRARITLAPPTARFDRSGLRARQPAGKQ